MNGTPDWVNGVPASYCKGYYSYASWFLNFPDVNRDGVINVLDAGKAGLHWQETGDPGWIPEDVNSDGLVNVLDMAYIGLHYQEK